MAQSFSFWKQSDAFVSELAEYLQGKRVLEVFAGNGLLASRLQSLGVEIVPTSLFKDYDWSFAGLHTQVVEMSAAEAVGSMGTWADILLMSWPEANNAAMMAALQFFGLPGSEAKKIVFIGERTDLSKSQLGGCATDEFFECFARAESSFAYSGNNIEVAEVLAHPGHDVIGAYAMIMEKRRS